MQYDNSNFELKQKLINWNKDPVKFELEGIPYLKEQAKESFEYAEVLFAYYIAAGRIFEADGIIVDSFKNDLIAKKYLEMFFLLYDQFSDTPDEALWAVTLLNKIEPTIEKHSKLISVLTQAGRYKEAMQEQEKLNELYPNAIDNTMLASSYLFSNVPEYIEKGKELLKDIDVEKLYPSEIAVGLASAKFYAGEVYDGLLYHFGGEDFRPKNFVSKKPIPNSNTVDFNDKRVVITSYRGMGDSMILSRFIPKFIEKWPKVKITIATEKSLIPLYKNIPGVSSVGDINSCAGKIFDVCLGVNMLARYIKDQLMNDEGKIPYHEWIAYPKEYDILWKDRFPSDKPLIGINWKGSQRLGGAPSSDIDDGRNLSRDIELNDFKYIIEMHTNKNFICLNPDISTEEKEWLHQQSNVIIPKKLRDFGDTAAIINLCDAVVSVDTSITTLSASLSKDTIVLAKYWPDYRWLHYEKWWDLSKMNISVFRKSEPDANWFYPVCNAMKELLKYDRTSIKK